MGTRYLHVSQINIVCKNTENLIFFPMQFSFFTAEKVLCILHWQVFQLKAPGITFTLLVLPLLGVHKVSCVFKKTKAEPNSSHTMHLARLDYLWNQNNKGTE